MDMTEQTTAKSKPRREAAPALPECFWVTRDQDGQGRLSDVVDAWAERPERMAIPGGGWMWLGSGETGLEARVGSWRPTECTRWAPTTPDTSLECIVYGTPPEPGTRPVS